VGRQTQTHIAITPSLLGVLMAVQTYTSRGCC